MQQRTSAPPLAWWRLRCCTNPLHEKRTVLLRSASMASTWTLWNTLLTWVASSQMMLQSAGVSTTACPKPVFLEDCQIEYCRVTLSASLRWFRAQFDKAIRTSDTHELYTTSSRRLVARPSRLASRRYDVGQWAFNSKDPIFKVLLIVRTSFPGFTPTSEMNVRHVHV